ncbi:hypothetical protein [Streptomyces sp. NPDC088254]
MTARSPNGLLVVPLYDDGFATAASTAPCAPPMFCAKPPKLLSAD